MLNVHIHGDIMSLKLWIIVVMDIVWGAGGGALHDGLTPLRQA